MKLRVFILVLFSILIYNCKGPDGIEFKTSVELTETVVEDIDFISRRARIYVVDSFLVLQKDTESYIQIYSTSTHKLLAEFGKKEEGHLNSSNLP